MAAHHKIICWLTLALAFALAACGPESRTAEPPSTAAVTPAADATATAAAIVIAQALGRVPMEPAPDVTPLTATPLTATPLTATPVATFTPTDIPTPTDTSMPANTPTETSTATLIATATATSTASPTAASTPNAAASATALAEQINRALIEMLTAMPTPTLSNTATPIPTNTAPLTPTRESTPASTSTPIPSVGAVLNAAAGNKGSSAPLPQWVTIPAGEFVMGSTEDELWSAVDTCNGWESNCQFDWFDSELPRRLVYLGEFEITVNEITNEQYAACVQAGACERAGRYVSDSNIGYFAALEARDHPVVAVNWYDAQAYCNWLGGRLPTEEEWEKAARGPGGYTYPWGNALDMQRASLGSGSPSAVGGYSAGVSPYGVHDMAGNAFEWTGSSDNGRFVLRGGSWFAPPYRARSADRGTKLAADFANYDIGFRCAR